MAKDRLTPCLYYVCAGLCQKGRKAEYSGSVKNVINTNQE